MRDLNQHLVFNMIDEDELIIFLTEHKIGLNQYFYLHCLYHERHNIIDMYAETHPIDEYADKKEMLSPILINDLIEKELIKKKGDIYEVTEKFKKYFIDKDKAFLELYNIYPKDKIKNIDNSIKHIYWNNIKGSLPIHNKVIKGMRENISIKLPELNTFCAVKFWLNFETF